MDSFEIEFDEHPSFTKDFGKLCKKYQQCTLAYRYLKTLLSLHFRPNNHNNPRFTLKVLHRLESIGPNILVYKVVMNTKGLSQGQAPRICFWIRGNLITFLCFGSHIDNYKDSELRDLAKQRIQQLESSIILS